LSKVPVRPSVRETVDFIATKLNIKTEDVSRIHLRTSSTNVFVEVKGQALALEIVEEHDGKHSTECQASEKEKPVTWMMDPCSSNCTTSRQEQLMAIYQSSSRDMEKSSTSLRANGPKITLLLDCLTGNG
uniref:Uncharacterized protein n=1 Tax=Anopheles dirus TaxID=7168 RepID=A0A182NX79_9DIPT